MSRTIKRAVKRVLRSVNEKVNPEDYHLPLPEPVPLVRTTTPKQLQKIYARQVVSAPAYDNYEAWQKEAVKRNVVRAMLPEIEETVRISVTYNPEHDEQVVNAVLEVVSPIIEE